MPKKYRSSDLQELQELVHIKICLENRSEVTINQTITWLNNLGEQSLRCKQNYCCSAQCHENSHQKLELRAQFTAERNVALVRGDSAVI